MPGVILDGSSATIVAGSDGEPKVFLQSGHPGNLGDLKTGNLLKIEGPVVKSGQKDYYLIQLTFDVDPNAKHLIGNVVEIDYSDIPGKILELTISFGARLDVESISGINVLDQSYRDATLDRILALSAMT